MKHGIFSRLGAVAFAALVLGLPTHTSATPALDEAVPPEIQWDTSLVKFQFDRNKFIGQRFAAFCPPAGPGETQSGLYGTDTYPSDSPICWAAVHAGVISTEGGDVIVQLNPGESGYTGSQRHDITSSDLPATHRSISFVNGPGVDVTNRVHLTHVPRIQWDTKFTATGLAHRHLVGQQFTFQCPSVRQALRPSTIYGTDRYAFHSKICRAAMHAGRVTLDGGLVTVRLDPGTPKLVGSIRNGVESRSSGGGDRTLSFVDNPVQP